MRRRHWSDTTPLTPRQFQVLRLIAEGKSERQIASTLRIGIHSAKWHKQKIYRKLGVTSRTGAVAAAYANGLLNAPERFAVQIWRRGYVMTDECGVVRAVMVAAS